MNGNPIQARVDLLRRIDLLKGGLRGAPWAILERGLSFQKGSETMKRVKAHWTEFMGIAMLLLVSYSAMLTSGCQSQVSGFLKKEFLNYQKVAILPFEGDPTGATCQDFTLRFKEKFREMEIFDQYRLLKMFRRETLYPNELSEAARAKISQTLGAQAVIVGSVCYPSITHWYLQVRVIDTQTGEAMGSSHVEMLNMGAEGMTQACQLAVEQLTPRD